MNPDVDAVVADLEQQGFHVGPGAESWIAPDQLAAIAQAAEDTGVPMHLVLVVPPERGIHGGSDLLVRVHDAGGPDGLYVGVNNVWARDPEDPAGEPLLDTGDQANLAVQQWGAIGGQSDLTRDVENVLSYGNPDGDPGSPYPLGEGLLTIVESLGDGTFGELVKAADEGLRARVEANSREREQDGGGTSTPAGPVGEDRNDDGVGVGDVTLVLLVVAVVAGAVALGRRARSRSRARQAFVLPDSVLDRVREAGDAELVRRARREVLALGESIDAAEMSGSGSAAWAAALDHYDAAGRLLPVEDRSVDPLDAAGAVVLAGRGREALAAARRGKAFTPSTPCFLNPLHGRAAQDRTLEHDGRRLRAPICTDCRRDLQAGRRPDVLDVVVRGTPRHYFETDREPWASTGFGALEPDLVARLQRGAR